MKYTDFKPGEWVRPSKIFHAACCDCGLVHKMEFRIAKGKPEFRMWRAKLRTKQYRKAKGITIK
jgi:hypothetical protein